MCFAMRLPTIVLADEMGLGKTIQSAVFLDNVAKSLTTSDQRPFFLIIVPLSTLTNWHRELQLWTDLSIVVYKGDKKDRGVLQHYEFNHVKHNSRSCMCPRFDCMLTTPTMIQMDTGFFQRFEFDVAIVDEAHYMKNMDSSAFKDFQSLHVFCRVLLTGTPIQMGKVGSNAKDSGKFIFGLLTLVGGSEHMHFSSYKAFTERFGNLDDPAQAKDLYDCMQGLMLRRKKEDVETTIPRKEETIIEVELTPAQLYHYKGVYERQSAYLRASAKNNVHHKLSNIAMELRKICNHPFLIDGAREELVSKAEEQTPKLMQEALVKHSGKFILLDKLLAKLREGGHKVLIFSQFKIVLDLIQEYLYYMQYPVERLDGDTSANERQRAIDRFSAKDSQSFVFLLSTRAGGLGINLVAADTAIIFDSDWNPQNDLQAQARCHRIGQDKEVKIYRFCTRNTYVRRCLSRHCGR